jgi:hypothetical protein
MCLNESYSKARLSKDLSDVLPIQKDVKQGDALSLFFLNFL